MKSNKEKVTQADKVYHVIWFHVIS